MDQTRIQGLKSRSCRRYICLTRIRYSPSYRTCLLRGILTPTGTWLDQHGQVTEKCHNYYQGPDQTRIVALDSSYFLKNKGHCKILVKSPCIDSTTAPKAVFQQEVSKLQTENFRPLGQLTLEPYEREITPWWLCSINGIRRRAMSNNNATK